MNGQTPELRPMSIGDILDATFRLYKKHFAAFLLIALVMYLPYALFFAGVHLWMTAPLEAMAQGAESGQPMAPAEFGAGPLFAMALGFLVFMVLVYPLAYGAMVHNISAGYLGQPIGAAESYRRALPRLPRLIVANFLAIIFIFIGFLLLIVPGIIFTIWLMLLTATVMLENRGVMGSLKRSRELMRGNLGKGFLILVVIGLIGFIFQFILGFTVALVPWPTAFLEIFAMNVAEALVLPVQIAPVILLYYDLRIRKEAFDLERLAEAVSEGEQGAAEPHV